MAEEFGRGPGGRFDPMARAFDEARAAAARGEAPIGAVVTREGSVLAAAGVYLGSNFAAIDRYVGPAAVALSVGIVLAYLWRVITWKPRAR